MKELTIGTMLAVFEEIFGFWIFWGMAVAAGLVLVAFVYTIVKDRSIVSERFLRAELLGIPLGAISAIWFVLGATRSGLSDLGGPIDAIVLIVVGLAGAAGVTILAYVAMGFFRRRRVQH